VSYKLPWKVHPPLDKILWEADLTILYFEVKRACSESPQERERRVNRVFGCIENLGLLVQ